MLVNYEKVDICQNEHIILNEINFQASEGEFIYIIGKVGSGKTSLLKTLYAEIDIKKGKAEVVGFKMNGIKRKQIPELRRQLGIVFQDFQLLTDRTVKANLDFVLKATGWKKKKEREQRIKEVLSLVEMTEKQDKMPYQLSGGEQQRICIARALLNHPKLIIADEATANLDVETGKRTVAILHSVCKNGTAVILSTHNEALIQDFPGIVYCCHDGTIDECTDNYRIK